MNEERCYTPAEVEGRFCFRKAKGVPESLPQREFHRHWEKTCGKLKDLFMAQNLCKFQDKDLRYEPH